MKFTPPFDPTTLDTMRGCDDAYRAITSEMRRINEDGTLHGANREYATFLLGLKAEIKNKKREIGDRHDHDRKGQFYHHLKAVLVERFGEAVADDCLREAGRRQVRVEVASEQSRGDARRLKGVGAALPPIGSSGGVRRRVAER